MISFNKVTLMRHFLANHSREGVVSVANRASITFPVVISFISAKVLAIRLDSVSY